MCLPDFLSLFSPLKMSGPSGRWVLNLVSLIGVGRYGEPTTPFEGIKLLGFKDRDELAFEDSIKHSLFIYPDELVGYLLLHSAYHSSPRNSHFLEVNAPSALSSKR